ncbi:MAG: synthase [Thermoanaerobaculia bacterium]|jgi:NAD+ synthase|nr:synthase [Thermoanaerobaculia bacterium]
MATSRVPLEVLESFPGTPQGPCNPQALAAVRFRHGTAQASIDVIVQFLVTEWKALEKIGLHGAVIGLSGGLDSVVTVRLCQMAAGRTQAVRAVTVNLGRPGDAERTASCVECARQLGVEHLVVDATEVRRAMLEACPASGPWSGINTDTRLIQDLVFGVADRHRSTVVSTGDLSEKLMGRQTEAFYGQLEPLGSLYKSEVIDIASAIELTDTLTDRRPGCEDYWYDDEVLGVGYDVIDPLLHLLRTENRPPSWIAEKYGIVDIAWIERLAHRVANQGLRTQCRWPAIPRISLSSG